MSDVSRGISAPSARCRYRVFRLLARVAGVPAWTRRSPHCGQQRLPMIAQLSQRYGSTSSARFRSSARFSSSGANEGSPLQQRATPALQQPATAAR